MRKESVFVTVKVVTWYIRSTVDDFKAAMLGMGRRRHRDWSTLKEEQATVTNYWRPQKWIRSCDLMALAIDSVIVMYVCAMTAWVYLLY